MAKRYRATRITAGARKRTKRRAAYKRRKKTTKRRRKHARKHQHNRKLTAAQRRARNKRRRLHNRRSRRHGSRRPIYPGGYFRHKAHLVVIDYYNPRFPHAHRLLRINGTPSEINDKILNLHRAGFAAFVRPGWV